MAPNERCLKFLSPCPSPRAASRRRHRLEALPKKHAIWLVIPPFPAETVFPLPQPGKQDGHAFHRQAIAVGQLKLAMFLLVAYGDISECVAVILDEMSFSLEGEV